MTTSRAPKGDSGRHVLPTERINVTRQLDFVDVVAQIGGLERRPVSAAEAGHHLSLRDSSVAESSGFLVSSGLLEPGRGSWAVTPAGLRLAELRGTDSARARLYLRDRWSQQWFTVAASKFLANGPLEEEELARRLRGSLSIQVARGVYLVEWLAYALIVHRDEQRRVILAPQDGFHGDRGQSAARESEAVPDVLVGTTEQITSLPDGRFLAAMDAYRAFLVALAPGKDSPEA